MSGARSHYLVTSGRLRRAAGKLDGMPALTIRLVARRHVDFLRICSAMCRPTD